MFRHKTPPSDIAPHDQEPEEKKTASTPPLQDAPKEVSLGSLQELLEKNLKWSQIIYEQNRRLNSKLMWSAIAGWVRLLIIIIPVILAVWFLPPYISRALEQYNKLFNPAGGGSLNSGAALERLLKLLPLDPAQEAQLRTMLK